METRKGDAKNWTMVWKEVLIVCMVASSIIIIIGLGTAGSRAVEQPVEQPKVEKPYKIHYLNDRVIRVEGEYKAFQMGEKTLTPYSTTVAAGCGESLAGALVEISKTREIQQVVPIQYITGDSTFTKELIVIVR